MVISAGVALLSFNTARQVNDGITSAAGYYSAIIGPSGSRTQLAMNTMYFTDSPLGTLPYDLVRELRSDNRVNAAIPFAMADSYNGFNVVGTESAYLDGKELRSGEMFGDDSLLQVVAGYRVASACGLKVGDVIYTSHAAGEEHKTGLTVCGILSQTHTAFDNQLFTQIGTLWEIHEHEEEEGEEEEHHEEMNGMVCAVLVRAKNPGYAMALVNEYNNRVWHVTALTGSVNAGRPEHRAPGSETPSSGENAERKPETSETEPAEQYSLQAIEPMDVVRGVLEEADSTRYIVYVLCGIILVMNIMIISVITLLNMYHSADEIALMRLIGISMKKINQLYILQNGIIGAASTVLAFGMSRACLGLMSGYVEKMGVVLDYSKVYPEEIAILAGVLIITVLPTVICTLVLSGRDGLRG
ncbi:MAG: hypothetical protein CW338_12435 [Clostridiales bacterium]|nr:hypothetical protein [Clostridiales bacterium]